LFFTVVKVVLLPVGVPLVEVPAVAPLDALLEALLLIAAEVAVAVTVAVGVELLLLVAIVNAAQPLVKPAAIAPIKHSRQF
jgi:hypothetical protein